MTAQSLIRSPSPVSTPSVSRHGRERTHTIATVYDVAQAAGVSIATVSRALRGAGRVADPTRRKVLDAAARLHYVASPTAASLSTGRTNTIAVLAPSFDRWFHAATLDAVQRALHIDGYDTLVLAVGADPADILGKRVDGLLVVDNLLDQGTVSALASAGVPVVLVGNAMAGCSSVHIDDAAAATAATRHLLRLGHTRIAFIGTASSTGAMRTSAGLRRRGWLATLAAAGLGVPGSMDEVAAATIDGGRDAMFRLLQASPETTAVVAASDEAAIGAVLMLRQSALGVPNHISVMGIGDHEFSAAFGLTTMSQPVGRQARIAAEMLVSAIRAPRQAPQDVCLSTSLIERATTGRARNVLCRTPDSRSRRGA